MPGSLDGKSALIIDGLTDVGTAIALKLASEGADIALSYPYRREKPGALVQDLQKACVKAIAIQADHTRPGQVSDIAAYVALLYGKIDILVLSTSCVASRSRGKHASMQPDNFANSVQAVIRAIRESACLIAEAGRIITLISTIDQNYQIGAGDHAAATSALMSFLQQEARHQAYRGVTVNVVDAAKFRRFDEMHMTDPIDRHLRDTAANTVAYLTLPEARDVTGRILMVDTRKATSA